MKVLIISSTCSELKYKEICCNRTVKVLDTNQKFFLSIIDGLKRNGVEDITCVSVLPVSYKTSPERYMKKQIETVEGVTYNYCRTVNLPIVRTIDAAFQIKKTIKKVLKEIGTEDLVVIADALFFEFGGACDFLRKNGIKTYAIVTDIPDFATNSVDRKTIKGFLLTQYEKMTDKIISQKYDGYIFLTKQMNEICNKQNKPYTVIEGLLGNQKYPQKVMKSDDSIPTVLYAGKINSEFGALTLAQSAEFLKGICNIEMYGAIENCDDILNDLQEKNENLSVNGIIPLDKLLEKETNSYLLVNPRPAGQEFTKYSFPSKTLEYMRSGTPVLMYKLEGVPDEYDEYLYYIKGQTPVDMAQSIKRVLEIDKYEYFNKGIKAQNFVEENKNSQVQIKKLLDFIKIH